MPDDTEPGWRTCRDPGHWGDHEEGQAPPRPELLAAAEQWVATVWEPFAARWAEVTAAKALHRDLFQQRELLATDRESVELVWGFGRLRWKHDGEVIDHPLICIPVEVEQDQAHPADPGVPGRRAGGRGPVPGRPVAGRPRRVHEHPPVGERRRAPSCGTRQATARPAAAADPGHRP